MIKIIGIIFLLLTAGFFMTNSVELHDIEDICVDGEVMQVINGIWECSNRSLFINNSEIIGIINLSSLNASHFNSINCSAIFGGTDGDFCTDDTGAGGATKKGDGIYLYNDTLTMYLNITAINETLNNSYGIDTDTWNSTLDFNDTFLDRVDNNTLYDACTAYTEDFVNLNILNLTLDLELISWWRMDDYDGVNTYYDYTGKNDGVVYHNSVNQIDGHIGKGVDLINKTAYINVSNDKSLKLYKNFTISAWIYPEGITTFFVFTRYLVGGAFPGYALYTINDIRYYNGATTVVGNGKVPPYTWSHIAITYNDTHVVLYLNGEVDKVQAVNPPTDWAGYANIGRQQGGNSDLSGWVDDVMVFNKSLTADEMEQIYRMGAMYNISNIDLIYSKEYISSSIGSFNYLHSLVGRDNYHYSRFMNATAMKAEVIDVDTIKSQASTLTVQGSTTLRINMQATTGTYMFCGNRFSSPVYTGYALTDTGNEYATVLTTLDTEGKTYTCLDCIDYDDGSAETCSTDDNGWFLCEFKIQC